MKPRLYLSVVLLGLTATAWGSYAVAVDRYVSVEPTPRPEQSDLLLQTLPVHFPATVHTVGEAIHYLLRYSGYSLVAETQQSTALKTTLQKPLPLLHRHLELIPLNHALLTLVGPAFTLVDDPLTREISFKVKPAYRPRGHS